MVNTDHAFLSCSGSGAWVNCAAFPRVSAMFPENDDSEDAMRGVAAHWLLEHSLEYYKHFRTIDYEIHFDKPAPNGIIIDREMIDGVTESVNDVINIIGDKEYLWESIYLEMELEVKRVHPTECWGTADIVIVDWVNCRIYILDFKYGHVYVEPWFNWQLMLYACGATDYFFPNKEQQVTLYLQTLQPRSYSNSKAKPWRLLATELRGYINIASNAAEKALSDEPIATTGGWCKYCTGRHACNTYLRAVENCLDFAEQATVTLPSAEAVGVELQMIDRAIEILESRRIAASVSAENLISKGKDVPGYQMVSGSSALKWVKSDDEIVNLGKLLGVELSKPLTCITPTQAIAKGINEQVILRYSERKSTGYKLKPFNKLDTLKVFKRGNAL